MSVRELVFILPQDIRMWQVFVFIAYQLVKVFMQLYTENMWEPLDNREVYVRLVSIG